MVRFEMLNPQNTITLFKILINVLFFNILCIPESLNLKFNKTRIHQNQINLYWK